MDRISISGLIAILIIASLGLYIILNISPDTLSRIPHGANLTDEMGITFYETLYIWRDRIFDTITQSLVLFAALSGVLIYVLWRGGSE